MQPIDFKPDGTARDPQLFGAVQVYAKNTFGEELQFGYYAKLWAAIMQEEGRPYQVIGILGLRSAIDVCTFHVTPPTLDKDGLRVAEQARDMMFVRGHDYIADLGNTGQPVLVYVAAEAQRFWRKFLKRIGAKPADRFEVTI